MRGKSKVIRSIADALLGTKGVSHGKLVVTTMGDPGVQAHTQKHDHEHHHHHHDHGHDHEHHHDHA